MGYDIRLLVVQEFYLDEDTPSGEELAMIELGKCSEGPVYDLVQSRIKKEDDGKPPFALYSRTPPRQDEAVEVLRELADIARPDDSSCSDIKKLADDIENGMIDSDKYGYHLGVFTLDEMIAALEADTARIEYRGSVWALALLRAVKDTSLNNKRLRVISYSH